MTVGYAGVVLFVPGCVACPFAGDGSPPPDPPPHPPERPEPFAPV